MTDSEDILWQEINRIAQVLEIAVPAERPPRNGVSGWHGGSRPTRRR
jgi:hypothetical protein